MSTDTTADATSSTIASRSGINWLTPLVCVGSARSTVAGIVIVVMAVISLMAKNSMTKHRPEIRSGALM